MTQREPCCPSDRLRRHGLGTAIIGLGLLAVGVVLTLDNMRILDADDILPLWPVLLILLGLSHILRPPASRRIAHGLIWVFIGAVILLSNLGLIAFDIWDLWPVILIIAGGSLLLRPLRRRLVTTEADAATFEATAVLGGTKRRIASDSFQGGDATAVLGGCEIDLRGCSSQGGPAEIDVFAFCGGIEIWVPEDWHVDVKGTAILAGFDDKTHSTAGETTKTLTVRGTAIMAGVDIKN